MNPRSAQLVWVLLLALSVSCGESAPTNVAAPSASARGPTTPPPGAAAPTEGAARVPPPQVFREGDFLETERSRDPFRSYVGLFVKSAGQSQHSQRNVVLDAYSLDELKLIGIVTKINPPKAMLVDPLGKGHVITRGQFVGRAELVQGGRGTAEYEVNWRVERIRSSDVVFVREDPSNPNVPTATRVIPLRSEEVPSDG